MSRISLSQIPIYYNIYFEQYIKYERCDALLCCDASGSYLFVVVFQCKPLQGFGFQRGGYMCECRPGFRYPEYIQGPYLGVAIERATDEEHKAGFHCLESNGR